MLKSDNQNSFKYEHYYKPSPIDTTYSERLKAVLIDDPEEAISLLASVKDQLISYDSETTGLDFNKDHIVGVSFSVDGESGYYLPFRHSIGKNLPESLLQNVYDFLCNNKILLYNAVFDLLMLKREGFDIDKIRSFDVMILVFNIDTNEKILNLKKSALRYLGREAPTFQETIGNKATFDEIDPKDCTTYAVYDTASTYAIYMKLFPILSKETKFILKTDAQLTKVMLYINENPVFFDVEAMSEISKEMDEVIKDTEDQTFKFAGRPFRISSAREITHVFTEMGLDTGKRTKAGDMGTAEKDMEKVSHPIASLITKWKSLKKQQGSYADKLGSQTQGFISYKPFGSPTARLASGQEREKNPYFLSINYQNLTKPKEIPCRAIGSNDPDSILGWKFEKVSWETVEQEPEGFFVEAPDPYFNVRRAVTVPDKDNWYFVKVDYESQELKAIAGLSKEPLMLEAFKNDEDIYETVGKEMFGDEYTSAHRQIAKVCVLGLNYGGCLSGNTMIITDKGWRQIDSLLDDSELKVWNGEGWKKARAFSSGIKETKNIVFKDRSILDITDNHVVFVLKRNLLVEKPVCALRDGDMMVLNNQEDVKPFKFLEVDRIEEGKIQEVYDIEVLEGKPRYFANGLMVHNSWYTLHMNAGFSESDAKRHYKQYWKTLRHLKRWIDQEIARCYQRNGVCYSVYGRPRRLGAYLRSPNNGMRKFGERSIISHEIQGCLQGKSLVLTNKGLIQIDELYRIQIENLRDKRKYPTTFLFEDCKVWTGEKWVAFNVVNRGTCQLVTLHFRGGRKVFCDKRHEILCHRLSDNESEFRKISELGDDTRVCANKVREVNFDYDYKERANSHAFLFYWIGRYWGG